jgi:hypothetical protein
VLVIRVKLGNYLIVAGDLRSRIVAVPAAVAKPNCVVRTTMEAAEAKNALLRIKYHRLAVGSNRVDRTSGHAQVPANTDVGVGSQLFFVPSVRGNGNSVCQVVQRDVPLRLKFSRGADKVEFGDKPTRSFDQVWTDPPVQPDRQGVFAAQGDEVGPGKRASKLPAGWKPASSASDCRMRAQSPE